MRRRVAAAGLEAERLATRSSSPRVAERIAAGDVVGWFQGRMEFGPRALGNRSIVADPRRAEMKDILNARVKHREPFRPFAPSVLAEETATWFEQDHPSPFMVLVYKTRAGAARADPGGQPRGRHRPAPDRRGERQPALPPADLASSRGSPAFPSLLNTSFNENEPIVMTPAQAVDTFLRTRMDLLVLGNRIVSRAP